MHELNPLLTSELPHIDRVLVNIVWKMRIIYIGKKIVIFKKWKSVIESNIKVLRHCEENSFNERKKLNLYRLIQMKIHILLLSPMRLSLRVISQLEEKNKLRWLLKYWI